MQGYPMWGMSVFVAGVKVGKSSEIVGARSARACWSSRRWRPVPYSQGIDVLTGGTGSGRASRLNSSRHLWGCGYRLP